MWNPFARRDEAVSHAAAPVLDGTSEELATARNGARREAGAAAPAHGTGPGEVRRPAGGPIAEIELMGQTAVATLTVTELTQEEGAEGLAELLHELAETGAIYYVLDVQNVRHMDTACLGCLVEALNSLADRGGRIALANPNHSVHYVFRLTRLDRVFRICPNVIAALEAVERRREAG